MLRYLLIATIVIAASLTHSPKCHGRMVITQLAKGEVPEGVCSAPTVKALKKSPPIGGRYVIGNGSNVTLYYRGTQKSLQELVNDLAKVKDVQLIVVKDNTGDAVRFFAGENLRKVYQFSVNFGTSQNVRAEKAKLGVVIKVHRVGGIDPDKLVLPDGVVSATEAKN